MSAVDGELKRLLAKLKKAAGTPQEQMAREVALSRFLADTPPTTRVFCRGDVRTEKGFFPAILALNTIYGQVLAWAPSGRKNAIESHSPSAFYGSVPLAAIAKEVLDFPETTAIAMSAGTAKTEGLGSEGPPARAVRHRPKEVS